MQDGYHKQDGCWNCLFVFERRCYDLGPYYFCMASAPPRPPCMSVATGECPGLEELGRGEGAMLRCADESWKVWSKGREVEREGICPRWGKQK